MPDLAWLDGEWLPIEEARVPVLDRGNMFGDGVYEVVRSYDGRLWALDLHLERLARSLQAIGIAGVTMAEVRPLVEEGNRRGGYANARVYLHVTRGVAPRVHTFPTNTKPTLLITVEEQPATAPALYEQGVAAVTLPELRWARRDIKSLNLLPNIMARQQAAEAGAFEAILVQPDGIVTEGASHGIFMVDRGVLITREEARTSSPASLAPWCSTSPPASRFRSTKDLSPAWPSAAPTNSSSPALPPASSPSPASTTSRSPTGRLAR